MGCCLGMCDFITVTISLWKSERPVSKTEDFWKQFALLVKNRSMHDGFEWFLKQVGCLIISVRWQILQKMTYWSPYASFVTSNIFLFMFTLLTHRKTSNFDMCFKRSITPVTFVSYRSFRDNTEKLRNIMYPHYRRIQK